MIRTTNDTVVKLVTLFADNLFEGESFVHHPRAVDLNGTVRIPLRIDKDVQIDLKLQVLTRMSCPFCFVFTPF